MAVKAKTKAKSSVLCMCIKDGREYPSDRFYAHKNLEIFPKGYIPYCKDCCNDILQYYLKKTGTIEASIWYMCALLDIPFIKRVFEKVQDMHVETDKFFETYYTYLWGAKSMKKALDTWESFADSDVGFEEISATVKDVEAIKVQKDALELKWGLQESEEDYQYLEYLYNRYTQGTIKNPYQEDLYRDLCLARLEKRKIEQNQSSFDITKTQARILTLMNKLGIDDFETSKPKSLSEQLMFAKIAQIEMTKPCDLYKEPTKYKDFNKVKKYYKDICLRALKNTLAGTRDFDIDMTNLSDYNLETEE
jgi:hypothetical protein